MTVGYYSEEVTSCHQARASSLQLPGRASMLHLAVPRSSCFVYLDQLSHSFRPSCLLYLDQLFLCCSMLVCGQNQDHEVG